MTKELDTNSKVVGLKQVRRALRDGTAEKVFIARDAGAGMILEIEELCKERGVVSEYVPTMAELGRSAGISVRAAVAAIVRQKSVF